MSDKTNKSLKPGWRQVKFGDVVQLSKARSQDPLADGIERYVGFEHLEPGDLSIRSWGNVSDGVTFTSVFQPGQVLFGKRRAYQRKVAVADFGGVCSGDIYVLETKDPTVLLPELLPFICQTDAFFDHAVGTSAGSLSPRTNWTSLASFELPLPPASEQKPLTETFAAISEANAALRGLAQSFEDLQQAAIDDFFADGLSDDQTTLGTESKAKPGWSCLTGSELLANGLLLALQDGNHGSQYPRSDELGDSGFPYIAASDIGENGEIDLLRTRRIAPDRASALRIPPALSGDVVLTHNATVGRVAILPPWQTPIVVSTSTTYYRTNPNELSNVALAALMRSSLFRAQLASYMRQSTRNQVPITTQKRMQFLVPPLAEQRRIEALVSSLQSQRDCVLARRSATQALTHHFSKELGI